jgi:prepilin-type N-terminal cleavage/methylation domain-containing protein
MNKILHPRNHFRLNALGFTLIEITMVILLVAILAVVAVPQFIDFRTEARNAQVNSSLGALRSAIVNQTSQMQLRCDAPAGKFPATASINANDITDASNNVASTNCGIVWPTLLAAEKQIMAQGIPPNPWSTTGTTPGTIAPNLVTTCGGLGCSPVANPTKDCTGAGLLTTAALVGGWCYDPSTGKIWPNSANNGGATQENTF